jgi:hypothetical protein
MKSLENFGIIITTYLGDFHLTKGLLASIKYFAPELPICIIQDGDFDMSRELGTYNIQCVLKKSDVKNSFLRENCFGSRCTNMIAFWESPFESFLYLDSDTVLWGNICTDIERKVSFIHNTPHEPYNDYIYKTQYCDFERLFNHVDPIAYPKYHLFNAGVFYSKGNIFDLEVFKKLFYLWKEDRSLMPAEPQGMINYLVFHNFEKNKLNVTEHPLQTVVPVKTPSELKETFTFENGVPIVKNNTVIHWAGTKPLLMHRRETYIEPMVFFRKQHLKNIRSIWRFWPTPHLYWEEFNNVLNRYHNGSFITYLKKKIIR